LIVEILRRLETVEPGGYELKTWHLSRFIKLLGKRAQFHPQELAELYGLRIVKALSSLLGHHKASLRLELYRALVEYSSFISLDYLKKRMQEDSDMYIRSLGDKLTPSA
jgi:hypothetical protein